MFERVRAALAAVEVPEPGPELARIRKGLAEFACSVRGGATFGGYTFPSDGKVRPVWVECSVMVRNGHADRVTLRVGGAMTYKDRTDSGATVEIVREAGRVWSWCKSATWNANGRYVDMPDGARKNVAAAVLAYLESMAPRWADLARDGQAAERARAISHAVYMAGRELGDAERVPLPLPASPSL